MPEGGRGKGYDGKKKKRREKWGMSTKQIVSKKKRGGGEIHGEWGKTLEHPPPQISN